MMLSRSTGALTFALLVEHLKGLRVRTLLENLFSGVSNKPSFEDEADEADAQSQTRSRYALEREDILSPGFYKSFRAETRLTTDAEDAVVVRTRLGRIKEQTHDASEVFGLRCHVSY
jgi:hypothetical protein